MRFPVVLLLFGMLVVPVLRAESIRISGFVTSAVSSTDFDVNAVPFRCGKATRIVVLIRGRKKYTVTHGCPKKALYIGEPVRVEGSYVKKLRFFRAQTIVFPGEDRGEIHGAAVIDALPASQAAASGNLLVRADGYHILITSKTQLVWDPPLHSLAEVKAGDWISYVGQQRADGIVVAEEARLTQLTVSKGEQKFRKKSNYNPSKVPASAKQNPWQRAFIGVDYKKIPPATNPAMQARVTAIGEKLIPAFERGLPKSDPARIHFRFQIINRKQLRYAVGLPSGVILVPVQVVERLQNNSQLAAVLAESIAEVVERQAYRALPAERATTAAVAVADAFVPDVGLAAPLLAGYGANGVIGKKEEDQGGRVALDLMHDAGYEVDQAPVAWWLLAPKKPKPIAEIALPHFAAYLYRILGENWNNPRAVSASRQNWRPVWVTRAGRMCHTQRTNRNRQKSNARC